MMSELGETPSADANVERREVSPEQVWQHLFPNVEPMDVFMDRRVNPAKFVASLLHVYLDTWRSMGGLGNQVVRLDLAMVTKRGLEEHLKLIEPGDELARKDRGWIVTHLHHGEEIAGGQGTVALAPANTRIGKMQRLGTALAGVKPERAVVGVVGNDNLPSALIFYTRSGGGHPTFNKPKGGIPVLVGGK
jgi:hypothetical protein